MLDEIKRHHELTKANILQGFGINSEEELELEIFKAQETDIEKAKHQDGEMHPNGKWVWVAAANRGKGDWRVYGGRAHSKLQAGAGAASGGSGAGSSSTSTLQSSTQPKTTTTQKIAPSVSTKEKTKSAKDNLPTKMESISNDMDEKYLSDKRPFVYMNNGAADLNKDGKKGFVIWVGFEHASRGRQPVDRAKMQKFVHNTAVNDLIKEVNERTGGKFSNEDVKIDDRWNTTDAFRLYIETGK